MPLSELLAHDGICCREEGLSEMGRRPVTGFRPYCHPSLPELTAKFHYERYRCSHCSPLIAQQLKSRPGRMARVSITRLPFWSSKRLGFSPKSARGERGTAPSGTVTRDNSNGRGLTPTESALHAANPSRSPFVMYLLHAIRQRSLYVTSTQSDAQRQRRDLATTLACPETVTSCDPEQEVETCRTQTARASGKNVRRYQDADVRHRAVCTDPPYGSAEQRSLGRI